MCVYLVSWLCVWWCPWRFCSWSCLPHRRHTCPPALRSRPHRHSPLSVHRDTKSSVFPQGFCSSPALAQATHLALPTHTHTVRVLVWAACAIQDHPLHEDHVPRLFGLAMQVAAFCSCGTNQRESLNASHLQLVLLIYIYEHVISFFIYGTSSPWVSTTLSFIVSAWVMLQLHEAPDTKSGSLSQWEPTLPLNHVYYRWTWSRDNVSWCFDTNKQVADGLP